MKNITLSAQEDMIEKVRIVAASRHRTLNDLFREWLTVIGGDQEYDTHVAERLDELWRQTGYLCTGKKFTREEMNER